MVSAKLPQARLQHILEQIDGIVAATQGLAFAQVDNNFVYERAVERAVQTDLMEKSMPFCCHGGFYAFRCEKGLSCTRAG